MEKVLKIFLKNSKVLKSQEIYCIRLNFNDGLDSLKSKIFMRCPQVKHLDPQIFWFDLENDKIRITCDDDLKFFMEESAIKKLVFDFHPDSEQDQNRKRSYSQVVSDAEASEYSKRIRQQLQKIDLSSDSSSMDTDDENESADASTSYDGSKNSSVNDVNKVSLENMIPSTSKQAQESQSQTPKVNIISVEVVKQPDPEMIVILDEVEDEQNVEIIPDETDVPRSVSKQSSEDKVEPEKTQHVDNLVQQEQSNAKTLPNRILISDSSEDEAQENTENNRRHSDAPFRTSSSAYSFASANGEGGPNFRTWTGHSSHRRRGNRYHHRTASDSDNYFNEQARNFQRSHAENIDRIHVHARMARDHAVNAVRASTSAIPDLLSSFQAHFRRPMFRVADINQQLFGSFNRR